MAVTKPLFINQVEYDAESERRGFGGLVAQSAQGVPRSGVLGPAPSVSLSGSTVQVGPFNAVIGSAKGAYLVAVDSVTPAEGTVVPADATNGRLDRVVLEVLDPDNGSAGTTRTGRLRVISGQAAAIPALPALPPLSLHVGQVQVPKSPNGAAVTPVVTVDSQFTAAAGAPVPVRSLAERDALVKYDGAQALRLDTPWRGVDTVVGGAWVQGGSAKQAIPLVSYNYQPDGPRPDGLAQEQPSVYRAGRRVYLSGVASNKIPITFVPNYEYLLGTLPVGFRPAWPEYFLVEVAYTNCRIWVRPDGEIRFAFPITITNLAPPLARFPLSGISFDAA